MAASGGGSGRIRLALRTQLWPVPTAGLIASVALGLWLPRLDASVDDELSGAMSGYLFGGGASAARSVLGAIASSLITVTSLTFSLTVVTLQLASSQYSPRLLRTFSRDRFVHVTLAVLLAGFTYSLTVLRTVRESGDGADAFVPEISVTVAFVLAVAGVLGLVLFLAHLAREIRVETVLHAVHRETTANLRRLIGESDADPAPIPTPASGAVQLCVPDSGFVVRLDRDLLLETAVDTDAVVLVQSPVGVFVVAGTPIAVAWPRAGSAFEKADLEQVRRRVGEAVKTGVERTEAQDLGFGLRQLVDVVTKALSPGINDPTTAVHALGHISALMCGIARQDPQPLVLRDDQNVLRVVVPRPTFADLLDTAITQPCLYGAGDPMVMERLFQLLRELAWTATSPDQHDAVGRHLARLRAAAARQSFDLHDDQRLQRAAVQVDAALAGEWAVSPSPART